MSAVTIVPTGVANTASVVAALGRLGCAARFAATPADVLETGWLVVPGVGAFDAALDRLRGKDLLAPLQRRVAEERPTLCICLGMQLLGDASDESPGATGLQCVAAAGQRFPSGLRVPHMGWSPVQAADGCEVLGTGAAYFAHSFRWTSRPAGWHTALATHGGDFVAGVERGAVVGCQFHPELSGRYGLDTIRRWLQRGGFRW